MNTSTIAHGHFHMSQTPQITEHILPGISCVKQILAMHLEGNVKQTSGTTCVFKYNNKIQYQVNVA